MPIVDPGGESLAQKVARLPPAYRAAALDGVDLGQLQYDANFWLRPSQKPPVDDFWIWLLAAGRGFGKTYSAAQWARKKAMSMPGSRGALVARTAADVRDVIVMGDSGLMEISSDSDRPVFEPSKRLVTWPNGSSALLFSSEEPSQLRGPQFHWGYAEELASWKWVADDSGLTAWDNLKIAIDTAHAWRG